MFSTTGLYHDTLEHVSVGVHVQGKCFGDVQADRVQIYKIYFLIFNPPATSTSKITFLLWFNFEFIAICILGGYFAVIKLITIGDLSAFITYSNQFTQPLMQLSGISGILQQTAAAFNRVFEFLHGEEETEDKRPNLNQIRLKCVVNEVIK